MIMMKKLTYLFVATIIGLAPGCKDFLDVDPVNQIPADQAINSVNDLEGLIMSMYNGLQGGSLYGANFQMYGDIMSDDTQVDEAQLSDFGTREIYQRATSIQLGLLRSTWADAYRQINSANVVLSTINNNVLGDQLSAAKADQLKAEALFMRAFGHFELVRLWAQPYDVENIGNNTQRGVPYRTEATESVDQDLNMARHSVEEVYSKALTDLDQAETFFQNSGTITSTHRSSEMAVVGLKARIKFASGDYVGASEEATKVIDSNRFTLFDSADGSPLEVMFETEGFDRPRQVIFQLVYTTFDHGLSGYYSQLNNLPIFNYASQELMESYAPNDLRKSAWFLQNPINLKGRIVKYDRPQELEFRNVPVIRLAEMHLIRAEANISAGGSGNTTEALESYNAVRERAFGNNFIEETGTNQLLEKIKLERRWELCFENDRYHNVKRMKGQLRDGVAYNDPSLLFKIPQEEIAGNDLIIQNP